MKKLLLATSVMTGLACAAVAPAMAQTLDTTPVGKAANTFMIRGRVIGVIPLNSSSSLSGAINTGTVSTSNSVTPELDVSYFFTDNIAMELIAATTKHDLYAQNSPLGSSYHVGSTWVLPPTLLLQYHFMPHQRFSPYIGAGVNVTFFYATQAANNAVTSLAMRNNVGAAVQAGFDYNFSGHWFANVDVKQIFLNTQASVNSGQIIAKTALNPLVIGAGIGYRF
jgi:outer membrane protein